MPSKKLATLDGPSGIPFELVFNPAPVSGFPAGALLAASLADQDTDTGRLRLWDISKIDEGGAAGLTVANFSLPEGFSFLAFSPDGQALAASSYGGSVRSWTCRPCWKTAGRVPATATLSGHDELALGLAFSPDGKLLASGAQDGTARLWTMTALQTGGSGAEVTVLKGHEGWATTWPLAPTALAGDQ